MDFCFFIWLPTKARQRLSDLASCHLCGFSDLLVSISRQLTGRKCPRRYLLNTPLHSSLSAGTLTNSLWSFINRAAIVRLNSNLFQFFSSPYRRVLALSLSPEFSLSTRANLAFVIWTLVSLAIKQRIAQTVQNCSNGLIPSERRKIGEASSDRYQAI